MKKSTNYILGLLLFSIQIFAQSWLTKATNFPAANTQVTEIAIANDQVVWSCNLRKKVFSKSTDGGNTWTPGIINIGTVNTYITGITAASASKAWVCAYDFSDVNNMGVFNTTDGGITWTKQTTAYNQSSSSFPNGIRFFDEKIGFTQGDPINENFEIYQTWNGGTNWGKIPTTNLPTLINGEFGLTNLFDYYRGVIWFGSSYGKEQNHRLFKSTNYGISWSVIPLTISGSGIGISFKDNNQGLVYGKANNVFIIQKSTDGGGSFTNIPVYGLPNDVLKVRCAPMNNLVIASTSSGKMYYANFRFSDESITFTDYQITAFCPTIAFNTNFPKYDIGFGGGSNSTATNGIFKFVNTISLLYSETGTNYFTDYFLTTDDGINYNSTDFTLKSGVGKFSLNPSLLPRTTEWSANSFPQGTGILAGTNIPISAGTYKINFNMLTGAYSFNPSLSIESFTNEQFKIFPNPVGSILNVQTSSNIIADKITIIDLSGKKILEQKQKTNEVDVSNLTKGSYFLEVIIGNKKEVKKFIKE